MGGSSPKDEQIVRAVKLVIAGFSKVYVVIDALDECQGTYC
jgi:hypothetical protein